MNKNEEHKNHVESLKKRIDFLERDIVELRDIVRLVGSNPFMVHSYQSRIDMREKELAEDLMTLGTLLKLENTQQSINFRRHKGSLKDSMETIVTLNSKTEFWNHISEVLYEWAIDNSYVPCVLDFEVSFYPYIYDDRIDWDTWIVVSRHFGVLGFTNGDPESLPQSLPEVDE